MKRCAWASSEISIKYHDEEWGVPTQADQKLFEFLILEGAQAGLNWEIILKKRAVYIQAFDEFDPAKVAAFDSDKLNELINNPGIIRNRRKIAAAVENAKAFIKIQKEFGSFNHYIWRFVDGKPIQNHFQSILNIPTETELSRAISHDLKKRGMKFVGPTIIYSFMQAVGMVNDHLIDCFRFEEIFRMG